MVMSPLFETNKNATRKNNLLKMLNYIRNPILYAPYKNFCVVKGFVFWPKAAQLYFGSTDDRYLLILIWWDGNDHGSLIKMYAIYQNLTSRNMFSKVHYRKEVFSKCNMGLQQQ